MFGFTSLFEKVLRLVKAWGPQARYRSEDGYRDELKEFLRTNLNKPDPLGIGSQKPIKVASESGRHLCDIAVDESVGIELKKDFNKLAEVDRLSGQLSRYKKQYSGIIVVLVGDTNKDAYDELVSRIVEMQQGTGISLGISARTEIKVVDKGVKTKVENAKTKGPYWWNPLTGKNEPLY
jgi:hypothetical protein